MAEAEAEKKSIVNPKYRDKYKEQDWLGAWIAKQATTTKEVTKTVPDGDGTKTVKTTVPAGIDTDVLFSIAQANGLDVAKYESQKDSHGFAGRFRMTVRNMLQKVAKQRHGLYDSKGKFVVADAEWLKVKGAAEAPTHKKTGEKIPAPKTEAKAA